MEIGAQVARETRKEASAVAQVGGDGGLEQGGRRGLGEKGSDFPKFHNVATGLAEGFEVEKDDRKSRMTPSFLAMN